MILSHHKHGSSGCLLAARMIAEAEGLWRSCLNACHISKTPGPGLGLLVLLSSSQREILCRFILTSPDSGRCCLTVFTGSAPSLLLFSALRRFASSFRFLRSDGEELCALDLGLVGSLCTCSVQLYISRMQASGWVTLSGHRGRASLHVWS
jgi:hypothetical protein